MLFNKFFPVIDVSLVHLAFLNKAHKNLAVYKKLLTFHSGATESGQASFSGRPGTGVARILSVSASSSDGLGTDAVMLAIFFPISEYILLPGSWLGSTNS
jgi:hypothetical protein